MKDVLCPQGRFEIRLYDKNRKLLKVWKSHNQITTAGKELMFNRSFGSLFKCGSDVFGQVYSLDNLMGKYNAYNYHTVDSAVAVGLLNLGDKQNGLSPNGSFLPIYNSDFSSLDKVIGYASIDTNPISDGKVGVPALSRGSSVAAGNTRELAWEFPLNVAGGTFDTLAIAQKSLFVNSKAPNVYIENWKCLDKVNTKNSEFVSLSNAFCPPGVPGVTADNEILLNFSAGGKSKWRYNISTGEMKEVSDSEPFFTPIDATCTSYYIEGNYLYICYIAGSTSNASAKYKVYDISTQSQLVDSNISGTGSYNNRGVLLKYNNELYITVSHSRSVTGNACYKLTMGGSGYYTLPSSGGTLEGIAGISVPFDLWGVTVGNYNGQYLVVDNNVGYICTDPNNIADTLTGILGNITGREIGVGSGDSAGFISIGAAGSDAFSTSLATREYNAFDSVWLIGGTAAANAVNLTSSGIFFMREGHYSQLMSYVKLSSPITKSDDQIMTVAYAYSFGSDSETVQV